MYTHTCAPNTLHTNTKEQSNTRWLGHIALDTRWLGHIALVWHRPIRNQKDPQLFRLDLR